MRLIRLSRAELKRHKAEDYPEGTIIAVGKYRISIKYGQYKYGQYTRPLKTTVSLKDNLFRDIPLHRLPYYIRDFI